jgi:hypothetical protein
LFPLNVSLTSDKKNVFFQSPPQSHSSFNVCCNKWTFGTQVRQQMPWKQVFPRQELGKAEQPKYNYKSKFDSSK